MTVVETRSVTPTDGDDVVVEVIKAMAAAKNVSCTALDFVLSDVVDTDSLARLFERNPADVPGHVSLTVSIDGFHVTLRMAGSHQVTIEVTQPPYQATVDTGVAASAETGGLGE